MRNRGGRRKEHTRIGSGWVDEHKTGKRRGDERGKKEGT